MLSNFSSMSHDITRFKVYSSSGVSRCERGGGGVQNLPRSKKLQFFFNIGLHNYISGNIYTIYACIANLTLCSSNLIEMITAEKYVH